MEEKRVFEKAVTTFRRDEFIAAFGGIFEDAPWIAELTWEKGMTQADNVILHLHERMCGILRAAKPEQQMALICAHPELAAPLHRQKRVGQESTSEQKNAGLNDVSDAEATELANMNRAYREKFGFPFIMAVAQKNKHDILATLRARLCCGLQEEKENALREICMIALHRLRRL